MATSIRPIWQMASLLFVAQVTLHFFIPKVLSRILFFIRFFFFLDYPNGCVRKYLKITLVPIYKRPKGYSYTRDLNHLMHSWLKWMNEYKKIQMIFSLQKGFKIEMFVHVSV